MKRVATQLRLPTKAMLVWLGTYICNWLSGWLYFYVSSSPSDLVSTVIILPPLQLPCQKGYASLNSKHQHAPGLTSGEFFKVVKFPAPGRKFLRNSGPGAKNRQKPRPWGQFCGPSRQFCHDRETIRIFLVLFFSLAFFEFFQRLIIKLANTKFLSDSSIAQLRSDMYGKN